MIKSALLFEAMSPEVSSYETDDSDEEGAVGSDDEGNRLRKKVIRTHPFTWRSEEFTDVLQSLDRKIMRKKKKRES